jgi:hypothetical protein
LPVRPHEQPDIDNQRHKQQDDTGPLDPRRDIHENRNEQDLPSVSRKTGHDEAGAIITAERERAPGG